MRHSRPGSPRQPTPSACREQVQTASRVQRRDFISLLGGLALLPGCAGFGAGGGDDDAACFDVRTGKRLGRRRMRQRLAPSPILLLGEVHDNAAHHRIRASLLADWVRERPSRPAVVIFEQLDREYNEALRLAQREQKAPQRRDGTHDGIPRRAGGGPDAQVIERLDAARFDRRSWGWPAHLPLFQAAQASGAAWIAANFSRASAQRLSRDPESPVDPALQAVVESARWSDETQAALAQALMQGHCTMLSGEAVAKIARVQRLRDAALALPLLDANERRSVLIAGNGHVRRDHGVPRYLGAYEYEALVVGFEEVAAPASRFAPAADSLVDEVGAARAEELGRAYDLVCLTPAVRRDDPCEGLAASGAPSIAPSTAPGVSPAAPMQTPSR